MNPFVDIEDELKRAELPVMPDDMRHRVLQAIRSEHVPSQKSRHNGGNRNKWVPWVSVAAGLVIAGGAGALVTQHVAKGVQPKVPRVTASHPASDLATTVPVEGQHVTTSNMDVIYPQFKGLPNTSVQNAINRTLKQASMPTNQLQTTGQNTFKSSYVVTYQRGNLVDIVITTSLGYQGADLGNQNESSFIYDLATGKRYRLTDLFKPTPSTLQQFSTLIKQADTNHLLGQTGFKYPTVQTTDTMVLTNQGVAIVFPEGEYTSRSAGTPSFTVKPAEISQLVNASSPLWKSIQATDNNPTVELQKDMQTVQSLGYQPASDAPTSYPLRLTSVMLPVKNSAPVFAIIGISPQSSPTAPWDPIEKIFFFQGTKYLGTDTDKAHGNVENIYLVGADAIRVDYTNGSQAAPSNMVFDIEYKWNGSRLAPSGSFPTNYTDWH